MNCTVEDLKKIRRSIELLGTDIEEFIPQAILKTTNDLDNMWYRSAANQRGVDTGAYPFDSNLILPAEQVTNLLCYHVLFLFYRAIVPDIDNQENPYVEQRDYFDRVYREEMSNIIKYGLTYDWDSSGIITSDEDKTYKRSMYDLTWKLKRG